MQSLGSPLSRSALWPLPALISLCGAVTLIVLYSAPNFTKLVGLELFSTSFPSFRIVGSWLIVTEGREWGEGTVCRVFVGLHSRMLSLARFSVCIHNPEFEQNPLSENPVVRVLELCRVHFLMGKKQTLIFKFPLQASCSKKTDLFMYFYITTAVEQLHRTVDKRGNVFILPFSSWFGEIRSSKKLNYFRAEYCLILKMCKIGMNKAWFGNWIMEGLVSCKE